MPYPLFDRSKLLIKPLAERSHDLSIDDFPCHDDIPEPFDSPDLKPLAKSIITAKEKNAAVIFMYGAHVVRSGCSPYIIEMMKRGNLTHLATNGAGSIHDFELSLIGKTCEDVERYVTAGQFGLWHETGLINDIIVDGCKENLGWGEALGRYIWENNLPYRDKSILAMAYQYKIPCTVHIGIGSDIIHEHPNFDGAAAGKATYTDFLIFTESVTNLENGVFLNVGSAVTGPEVYLKALSMARNVAKQEEKEIKHFTTAVFDVKPLGDDTSISPKKSNPNYYFRPWKTVLSRTTADGGKSYYIRGKHHLTIPNLAHTVWSLY
jgi:hypothetical protein